jgi:hypothetical protein
MTCPRIALWVAARLESSERHESLVGDLLEELANGRSRVWLWQQVIGMCAFALVAHARAGTRLTSSLIAFAPAAMVLGGVSVAPYGTVLHTWIGVYLVTGTLSLFGHLIASSSFTSRGALALPEDSELRGSAGGK